MKTNAQGSTGRAPSSASFLAERMIASPVTPPNLRSPTKPSGTPVSHSSSPREQWPFASRQHKCIVTLCERSLPWGYPFCPSHLGDVNPTPSDTEEGADYICTGCEGWKHYSEFIVQSDDRKGFEVKQVCGRCTRTAFFKADGTLSTEEDAKGLPQPSVTTMSNARLLKSEADSRAPVNLSLKRPRDLESVVTGSSDNAACPSTEVRRSPRVNVVFTDEERNTVVRVAFSPKPTSSGSAEERAPTLIIQHSREDCTESTAAPGGGEPA